MRAFTVGAFAISAVLAFIALGLTDFFESQRPPIEWAKHRDSLAKLKPPHPEAAGDYEKILAAIDQSFSDSDAARRHQAHKLQVAHYFIAIFVGCTGMFLSFLLLLRWNRSTYGIRISDSMAFTCLLDANVLAAAETEKLPKIREQLGLLCFYFGECRKITAELGRLRFPESTPVILEIDTLMSRLLRKLALCMVETVNPYDAEHSALREVTREVEAASAELADLKPKVQAQKDEHGRLTKLLEIMRKTERELRELRTAVDRDMRRVSQSDAELTGREKRAAAAEARIAALVESHGKLRDEVIVLMRMLEGWDTSTDGLPTQIVQGDGVTFPRLTAVAQSFYRRTASAATG